MIQLKEQRGKKMNKYQYALHNLYSFHLSDFTDQEEALIVNDNYKKQLDTLKELVDKADSQEWIPVTERLPEEYESVFAKAYGTDQWNNALWRARSKEVLVSIEYDDGTRTVTTSFTRDCKWPIEKKRALHDLKVIAWMPLPELYKGEIKWDF